MFGRLSYTQLCIKKLCLFLNDFNLVVQVLCTNEIKPSCAKSLIKHHQRTDKFCQFF
jgi:hypothetical protein